MPTKDLRANFAWIKQLQKHYEAKLKSKNEAIKKAREDFKEQIKPLLHLTEDFEAKLKSKNEAIKKAREDFEEQIKPIRQEYFDTYLETRDLVIDSINKRIEMEYWYDPNNMKRALKFQINSNKSLNGYYQLELEDATDKEKEALKNTIISVDISSKNGYELRNSPVMSNPSCRACRINFHDLMGLIGAKKSPTPKIF